MSRSSEVILEIPSRFDGTDRGNSFSVLQTGFARLTAGVKFEIKILRGIQVRLNNQIGNGEG